MRSVPKRTGTSNSNPARMMTPLPGAVVKVTTPVVAKPERPAEPAITSDALPPDVTVSVLGERALCVTEIVTEGWYDYQAKYAPGGSRHICPAVLPDDIAAACRDYALRAHQALGCRGLSRTDFRWDDARGLAGLYLLEINTQPGMTPTSLSPEQAAAEGMSYPDLCRWLVEDASCNR